MEEKEEENIFEDSYRIFRYSCSPQNFTVLSLPPQTMESLQVNMEGVDGAAGNLQGDAKGNFVPGKFGGKGVKFSPEMGQEKGATRYSVSFPPHAKKKQPFSAREIAGDHLGIGVRRW